VVLSTRSTSALVLAVAGIVVASLLTMLAIANLVRTRVHAAMWGVARSATAGVHPGGRAGGAGAGRYGAGGYGAGGYGAGGYGAGGHGGHRGGSWAGATPWPDPTWEYWHPHHAPDSGGPYDHGHHHHDHGSHHGGHHDHGSWSDAGSSSSDSWSSSDSGSSSSDSGSSSSSSFD
jgi:hypothetical protein